MPREMKQPCLGIVAAAGIDNRPMCGYELRQVPVRRHESQKFVVDFELGIGIPFHNRTPLFCRDDSRKGAGDLLIARRVKGKGCFSGE